MSSNKVSLNKIIIGTSAWGSKISYSNCYLILEKLLINGFDQFDTAPNYGSGYSQNIINSVLVKKNYNIVMKKYLKIYHMEIFCLLTQRIL